MEQLKAICKHYNHTIGNKRKAELIAAVRGGPKRLEVMTEQERFIKKTFLEPLPEKDRSAWRLGSKNEKKSKGCHSSHCERCGLCFY